MEAIPIPTVILLGTTVTLGIVTIILSEIHQRQYSVSAYLLWTATLLIVLLGLAQEAAMAGITMFFIAFIFVIASMSLKLTKGGNK